MNKRLFKPKGRKPNAKSAPLPQYATCAMRLHSLLSVHNVFNLLLLILLPMQWKLWSNWNLQKINIIINLLSRFTKR